MFSVSSINAQPLLVGNWTLVGKTESFQGLEYFMDSTRFNPKTTLEIFTDGTYNRSGGLESMPLRGAVFTESGHWLIDGTILYLKLELRNENPVHNYDLFTSEPILNVNHNQNVNHILFMSKDSLAIKRYGEDSSSIFHYKKPTEE